MMKRLLLNSFVLLCLLFSYTVAYAQGKTISGKVTSKEDGTPLPGVTIMVKGTTVGTQTDVEGMYKLSVADDAKVLVFSFVGMKTEEREIGSLSTIDFVMSAETSELNEVVVTAVGIESNKKALGYSVQTVKADELTNSKETNLVNAINSKVAGVQISASSGTAGAPAQIRIRGNRSIVNDNSPLFVIDGIPVDNSTSNTEGLGEGGVQNANRAVDINPDDIESMTVLKGAAATVLYGSRAANGAIIITTKKGGTKESKPVISFNTSIAIDQVNKLPELQKQYAQGRTTAASGAPIYRGPTTFEGFSWGPAISTLRYAPSIPNDYDKNGSIVAATNAAADQSKLVNAYDNTDNFFRTGYTYNNNISISGNTGTTNYYASIGNLTQTGIIPLNDFTRTSVKLTFDTKVGKKLRVGASASYVNSGGRKVQQGSNISGVMLGLLRTTPTFDISNGFGRDGANNLLAYSFPDGTQREYRAGVYDNPFWTVNKNPTRDNVNRVIGYVQASYDVLPWMKATYRAGGDVFSDFRKSSKDVNSADFPAGKVMEDNYIAQNYNSDFILSMNKDITPNFNIDANFGHNYYVATNKNIYTEGQGLGLPGLFTLNNTSSIITTDFVAQSRELHGVFGDVKLSYKDMLFLNISARNDWLSTLPNKNNSFLYPAVSLGFAFSELDFLRNNKILSYGKLRASYANVGNGPPIFATDTYLSRATGGGSGFVTGLTFPFRGAVGYTPGTVLGNPELKAENTATIEIGADLRFFDSRLSLDLTYYNSLTTDGIILADLPQSTGANQTYVNAAEISNVGFEAVVGVSVIKNANFRYDIGLNFTHYKNVVEKLPSYLPNITIDPFGTQRMQAGLPYGVFYGTKFLRNAQGQKIIDADGFPQTDPNTGVVGNPIPDFLAGLRNTVSYKGISVSALLDIRQGGTVYNGTRNVLNGFGVGAETLDREKVVVFEGVVENADGSFSPNTKEVQLGQLNQPTANNVNYWRRYGFTGVDELAMETVSWIRLRELTVSYSLPKSLLEKTKFFRTASFSLSARNLFLITNYKGIDPETNLTGNSSNVFGYDYFNNPNTKSYSATLNVSF